MVGLADSLLEDRESGDESPRMNGCAKSALGAAWCHLLLAQASPETRQN